MIFLGWQLLVAVYLFGTADTHPTHFPQQQWRNKYTGFEQVLPLAKMVQERLENHFGKRIRKRRLYVTELFQQLLPKG